jgi:hypothetical protein
MCEFSYANSKIEQFRKQFNRTGQARVVHPSEWAIMNSCPGPLHEAIFSLYLHGTKGSGPFFMFDDIDNSPIFVPDGEPSQPVNAFSSILSRKKLLRICSDFLWLQSQVIP